MKWMNNIEITQEGWYVVSTRLSKNLCDILEPEELTWISKDFDGDGFWVNNNISSIHLDDCKYFKFFGPIPNVD